MTVLATEHSDLSLIPGTAPSSPPQKTVLRPLDTRTMSCAYVHTDKNQQKAASLSFRISFRMWGGGYFSQVIFASLRACFDSLNEQFGGKMICQANKPVF